MDRSHPGHQRRLVVDQVRGLRRARRGEPLFLGKGQLEGIGSDPYFAVKNEAGEKVGEYDWPRGSPLGHAEAIRHIVEWIEAQRRRRAGARGRPPGCLRRRGAHRAR